MTTTFGSVELKNAGKFSPSFGVLSNETTLMSGKTYVQTSTEYKTTIIVDCMGTYADITALRALVGTKQTLTTDEDTLTNCVIKGTIEVKETDAPGYYNYRVTFVQHTAS